MNRLQTALLVFFCFSGALYAQAPLKDLATEIDAKRIALESATGNGASSGNAVEGYLVNQNSEEVHIDISLLRPLFMRNRGLGQNMVATRVLLAGGRYFSEDKRSFISLKPKERTPVEFVAYCVDFEKDNPTRTDSFSLETSPASLDHVMKAIIDYSRQNPLKDITVAAQAAIWLADGISIENIRTKFNVSPSDEILARSFTK